jgi:RHS repeat-associated protein
VRLRNYLGTTPYSHCHDANGNTTRIFDNVGDNFTASWTSYNQPSLITDTAGSASTQYYYDANHQRYEGVANFGGPIETTIYVGGLLEKVTASGVTSYRHYIPAGNNTVIYTRASSGTNSTYYVTKDHLGSTGTITDASGNLLVNESFSPFGYRRSGSTWGGSPSTGDMSEIAATTRRGFTSEDNLDNQQQNKLVNLNGRMLLSGYGRMLSPDPYVPDPSNTQSFNRYSYVNNNPLSFTDQSGFDLDPITVNASLGGPEDPVADVASVAVGIFDLGELFGWFGGGGPTLSPMQEAGEAHGINLSTPLQGAPSFQSVGGTASFATEDASSTVPQIVVEAARETPEFLQGFASAGGSFLFGNDATLAVSTEPSSDPNTLDQIDVNGVRYAMHGFDPIPFVPGGGALECIVMSCSGGQKALAAIGIIPFVSWESGAIGATGQIGEAALRQLGGESQVFFRTSQGARYVDQLVNGVANESKVGYQTLTQNLATQISKDAELIQSGQIQGAAWHFFTSPLTGLGGPSGPLAQALRQAGIQIIIH